MAKKNTEQAKEDKRAAALRANLKRRKARAKDLKKQKEPSKDE